MIYVVKRTYLLANEVLFFAKMKKKCILFQQLFLSTLKKTALMIENLYLKIEDEGQEFPKIVEITITIYVFQ